MKLRLAAALALVFLTAVGHSATAAPTNWPQPVVAMEDMVMLTPMRVRLKGPLPKGDVVRPVTMRVHVDAAGEVQRSVLIEGCGNAAYDEEALYVMRSQRFAPKLIDGIARDVTLVVPLHFPLTRNARR